MILDKKQLFHLEACCGLINDPNGLTFFKNKYYVFFQWNRLEKNHSYKEWGLFTSFNMIDWEFESTALFPNQYYDINGVYSGSACVINDQLHLFYTGNSKINNKRKSYQCLAVSDDGISFIKKGPIFQTPLEYTEHFRDPKVIKINENLYYMIVGAQLKNGKGAVALAKSHNGTNWSYQHQLAYSNKYQMIECPDLFKINDQYIMLYGLQNRDNKKDEVISSMACYKFVDFNEDSGRIVNMNLDKCYQLIDYGFDFYAPQTFKDDKRIIMYAWMSRMDDEQEKVFAHEEQSIHCLTIPRELHIKNGLLYQRPVRELYSMLKNEVTGINEGNVKIFRLQNRSFYLHLSNINNQFTIYIHGDEVKIAYNKKRHELELFRTNWVTRKKEKKVCFIDRVDNIEVWSDQSSIEVFINEGMYVLSSRIYPSSLDTDVKIEEKDKIDIIIKEIESGKNHNE